MAAAVGPSLFCGGGRSDQLAGPWFGFGVDGCEFGAEEFVGGLGVGDAVGAELEGDDGAGDVVVAGFEGSGVFEEPERGVGVVVLEFDVDEFVDDLEVAAAGGFSDGVGPESGAVPLIVRSTQLARKAP